MHRKVIMLSLLLCLLTGCGVSITTSGFKAGLIDEVTRVEDGSKVHYEDVTGITIQWLPYFSWADVKNWFKKEETPSGTQ